MAFLITFHFVHLFGLFFWILTIITNSHYLACLVCQLSVFYLAGVSTPSSLLISFYHSWLSAGSWHFPGQLCNCPGSLLPFDSKNRRFLISKRAHYHQPTNPVFRGHQMCARAYSSCAQHSIVKFGISAGTFVLYMRLLPIGLAFVIPNLVRPAFKCQSHSQDIPFLAPIVHSLNKGFFSLHPSTKVVAAAVSAAPNEFQACSRHGKRAKGSAPRWSKAGCTISKRHLRQMPNARFLLRNVWVIIPAGHTDCSRLSLKDLYAWT